MIEAQVPELADGGYWYVAQLIIDPETNDLQPDIPAGVPFAQWAWGNGECVIKTTAPLLLPQGSTTVALKLNHPHKPLARF